MLPKRIIDVLGTAPILLAVVMVATLVALAQQLMGFEFGIFWLRAIFGTLLVVGILPHLPGTAARVIVLCLAVAGLVAYAHLHFSGGRTSHERPHHSLSTASGGSGRTTGAGRVGGSGPPSGVFGSGMFKGRRFRPRSALVFFTESGIDINLYDKHYECGTANEWAFERNGLELDISPGLSFRGLTRTPVNREVPGSTATYSTIGLSAVAVVYNAHLSFSPQVAQDSAEWHGSVAFRWGHQAWFRGRFSATVCHF